MCVKTSLNRCVFAMMDNLNVNNLQYVIVLGKMVFVNVIAAVDGIE